jgi:hypothetical protein
MRDTGDNIGGIHRAWISLVTGLGEFPSAGISESITQLKLEGMQEIVIHPYKAGYQESSSDSDQGLVFPKTFTNAIPSDTDAVRLLISKYRGKDVVLIIQDLDFSYWLIFDKLETGKFLSDFQTGVEPVEGKLNSITISNTCRNGRSKLTLVTE